jgi:glyoxylate reductase
MEIHYFNRKRSDRAEDEGAIFHDTLESLLPASDVLCVSAPSTPETRASLNLERLRMLPRGASVVNVARGDLIDEEALIALVEQGHLGPVGLDVFRNEPNIDPRLKALPDAVLLPHIGSATRMARIAMGLSALDALHGHFNGFVPRTCLNPEAYALPPGARF